jgi:hypothetical protein
VPLGPYVRCVDEFAGKGTLFANWVGSSHAHMKRWHENKLKRVRLRLEEYFSRDTDAMVWQLSEMVAILREKTVHPNK